MKITIENTPNFVTLNGVPARIWEGETESGIDVICFVTRIVAVKGENVEEFERELMKQKAPSEEVKALPLRLIL